MRHKEDRLTLADDEKIDRAEPVEDTSPIPETAAATALLSMVMAAISIEDWMLTRVNDDPESTRPASTEKTWIMFDEKLLPETRNEFEERTAIPAPSAEMYDCEVLISRVAFETPVNRLPERARPSKETSNVFTIKTAPPSNETLAAEKIVIDTELLTKRQSLIDNLDT